MLLFEFLLTIHHFEKVRENRVVPGSRAVVTSLGSSWCGDTWRILLIIIIGFGQQYDNSCFCFMIITYKR